MTNAKNILNKEETAGLSIWECVKKCLYRGIREQRSSFKIAVSPEAWEGCLSQLLHMNRPLDVPPANDGMSARIRVFVCGKPVWLVADESMSDFDHLRWVDE